MKDLIKGTYDDSLEFLLPKGDVPYTACQEHNTPSDWKRQHKQLKYVVKGGPLAKRWVQLKEKKYSWVCWNRYTPRMQN